MEAHNLSDSRLWMEAIGLIDLVRGITACLDLAFQLTPNILLRAHVITPEHDIALFYDVQEARRRFKKYAHELGEETPHEADEWDTFLKRRAHTQHYIVMLAWADKAAHQLEKLGEKLPAPCDAPTSIGLEGGRQCATRQSPQLASPRKDENASA